MAIVGTAFVRLRVIGDTLKKDITSAVEKSVKDSAPNLATAGEEVGKKITEGTGQEIERGASGEIRRLADRVGTDIGTRMAESMGRSLRVRAASALLNLVSDPKTSFQRLGGRIKTETDRLGADFKKNVTKKMKDGLENGLFTAFSLAAVAVPSMLAWAGAVVGALGSTLVTMLAALGPTIAGGALAIAAGLGSIKLTMGLIGLAMKAQTPLLADFQKRTAAFKNSIAQPIQVGLFSGFNAAMRISQPVIKAINPMLKELGTNVGDLAIGFADVLRQASMLDRIQRILTVNNDFVRLSGAGVSALAQAFIILFDNLSPVIEYLANGARQLGLWVLATVQAADASGALSAWVSRMFNSMTFFVGALVNFGYGIINVFRAAFEASGGMINNLDQIGIKFRAWTEDRGNQQRMVAFFDKMRVITRETLDVLGQLSRVSLRALENTNLDSVTRGFGLLRQLGPQLAEMFRQIQRNAGPRLTEMFQNLLNVITQMAKSGVISTTAAALSDIFNIMSKLLSLPGVPQLLTLAASFMVLAKVLGFFKAILTPLWWVISNLLWPALEGLAAALGWPITIAIALTAALTWFFTQTKLGREIVEAAWKAIKVAIGATIDALVTAFHWVVHELGVAWDFIKGAASGIWNALVTAFNSVRDAVSTATTAVWNTITSVWNAVIGFITPILNGIWNVVQAVFNGIVTAVQTYLNILYQIWIRVWPILALPIRILYGVIIWIFQQIYDFVVPIVQAIAGWVSDRWNGMVQWVSDRLQWLHDTIVGIWNAIYSFVSGLVSTIVDWVVGKWNSLVDLVNVALLLVQVRIMAVWNAIWGFIQPIIESIVNFVMDRWHNLVNNVSSSLNWLSGIFSNVWNGIVGFIQGAMNQIRGIVTGVWDIIGNAGTAALSGIKNAINWVIDHINSIIHGINWVIDQANKLPGPDIPRIPDIPRLAKGGTVSAAQGGTLALIGEAGRSERVEPLDPSGLSARDRAMIKELAGGGQGTEVHVYLGTRELTELVDYVVEDRTSSIADRVLTGTKG